MINLNVIYDDDKILVVDKLAGVLVHPTPACEPDTVADWFLDRYPEAKKMAWPEPERAGIVHRLDKDTTGLMVVAKNPEVLKDLQAKFKERSVKKTYQALVVGKTEENGEIEAAIVRDTQNDQMKVQETTYSFTKGTVRPAITRYKVIKLYSYKDQDLSLVEVYPQTGRMHQIRVHFKYIGHPLVGDQMYQTKLSHKISKELGLDRQFLHAVKLEFNDHVFESELANDLKNILAKIS